MPLVKRVTNNKHISLSYKKLHILSQVRDKKKGSIQLISDLQFTFTHLWQYVSLPVE
jgi:hypothetical protein